MVANDACSETLIARDDGLLAVIDVQEKLMPVIAQRELVLDNVVRLIKFAEVIGLPVILTEQENLGATLPEIRDLIPDTRPIPKLVFNCFRSDEFERAVQETGRNTLVLTGVETHICVAQTALHALREFEVHVVSDATSSRTRDNWKGDWRGGTRPAVTTASPIWPIKTRTTPMAKRTVLMKVKAFLRRI
ncbi:MAG: isochorismatase family protein [Anaerolineae bacterium]